MAKAHTVQDISSVLEYTSGQALAQLASSPKPAQISTVCYSADVVPEKQDLLRMHAHLAAIQVQKNNIRNCCVKCGEPAQYANTCSCGKPSSRTVS